MMLAHIVCQGTSRPRTVGNFHHINDLVEKLDEFTAVHNAKQILFTWELRDKAKRKRWFYVSLKRVLEELLPKSWNKVGGSVYLVDERYSREFRELLTHFEGPELSWCESEVKTL